MCYILLLATAYNASAGGAFVVNMHSRFFVWKVRDSQKHTYKQKKKIFWKYLNFFILCRKKKKLLVLFLYSVLPLPFSSPVFVILGDDIYA